MNIRIFTTGGTIDGLEYENETDTPSSVTSIIPQLVKEIVVTVPISFEYVFSKDSKFITDKDRETLSKKCENAKEEKIIITHGTMTLVDTAKYLGKRHIPKTIVLLGAFIPANKEKSDALFNVEFALNAIQTLGNGVYVAMNGQIFNWNNVKKNQEKQIFEIIK